MLLNPGRRMKTLLLFLQQKQKKKPKLSFLIVVVVIFFIDCLSALFCSIWLHDSSSQLQSHQNAIIIDEIVKSLELWMKLIKKPQPFVDPDLDPVLLVPGIASSMLNAVDEETGREKRVWARILGADYAFRTKLWSRFDPCTGKTESLDPKTKIVVPEDRCGLHAIDALDPDLMLGQEAVYYFHDMIVEFIKWAYQEGNTLFGFGYDFRQSNRLKETLDRLAAKLEAVHNASGGKKINIISHSMRGLLVKCFMCLHSDVFEKYVKNWIAIVAPFQVGIFSVLLMSQWLVQRV